MTKSVFISYRRSDTAPAAGRVYDRVCRVLTVPNVFFDVSTIAGGEDFVTKVTNAIQKSNAVLVFIGRKWIEPTPEGVVRIWEDNDHVRAEVRVALQHAHMVLPILVDGAIMPRPEQLPEDIRPLCTINGLPLRHESFDDDTENILETIAGGTTKRRLWDDKGKLSTKVGYAVAGLIAALVLWILGGMAYFWLRGEFLAETIGNPATAVLVAGFVVAGAWLGFRYEARQRRRRVN